MIIWIALQTAPYKNKEKHFLVMVSDSHSRIFILAIILVMYGTNL